MELKAFINEWLKSWTGNNPNELLRYYADHTFYSDPATPMGISRKESLHTYFSKLLAKNPDWIWTADEIIPTEKGCTLKWKAKIPVGNQSIVIYGLDIVEISNWKIVRNEVYFDRTLWIDAIQSKISSNAV